MFHDTRTAKEKTTTFADTVAPYVEHGWPQACMLPAWPCKKQPGRYTGSTGWCGLEGNGLLKHGLSAAAKPTTWEQVQGWPTDGVCVLGGTAPGLDIDSEVPAVLAAVRALLPHQTYERGRSNSLRTLMPFRSPEPVKGWKPLKFTMDGHTGVQVVEFNGHGRQWVAAGRHRSGGRYVWRDSVSDMGGPPPFADLRFMDQMGADGMRESIARALESIGAVFVDGSRDAGPAGGVAHDMVETDGLEPMIGMELMERVLREIPDTPETVGGWDESIPLLASMRFVLGHLGASLPVCVEDWAVDYPGGSVEWIEGRWSSFDQGVSVREGTFLQWVEKHGSGDLSAACEDAVNEVRVLRGFESVEELSDDDYGPRVAPGGAAAGGVGGQGGNAPAGGRVAQLQEGTPNVAEAEMHILRTLGKGFVGWCEFSDRPVLRRPIPSIYGRPVAPFKPRDWKDNDAMDVLRWMQANGLRKLNKLVCVDACEHLANDEPFHPVRDYLRRVEWDGVHRLDTWLVDYCKAENPPAYLKAVGRAVLISAVARTMKPGCKVDTILVMQGRQSVGKSSLFMLLMPDEEWFSSSMPTDLENKDARQHLRGKLVIEMAELASFKGTRSNEALKSFLTTAVDRYPPPYGRHEVTYRRQGIFVASTNEETFLVDPTGNRRYWPVRFGDGGIDRAAVVRDRDQLWAEAVAAYDAGEQWFLHGAAEALAQLEQAERMQEDPRDELIADYLEGKTDVTLNGVMGGALLVEAGRRDGRLNAYVSRVMRSLGWATGMVRDPGAKKARRAWTLKAPASDTEV